MHPPKASLNVVADSPDFRDHYYQSSLNPLKEIIPFPDNLHILDQGKEGACTGFGLAATINLLYQFQNRDHKVSPHMLYEFARRYDEWPGESYEGSSCRGAIKGWKNTGVCLESLAPHGQGKFVITPEISEDAKSRTVGAYYRIKPNISDFHAAINEVGVIYVSAKVHEGWYSLAVDATEDTYIPGNDSVIGGHAFAIVGYNKKGFWVQNSWGKNGWGKDGLALWLYPDWAKNIMDAWVVQLALPTPQIFSSTMTIGVNSQANQFASKGTVPRQQIENHFVHLDDGFYHDKGRYWSNSTHMDLVQEKIKTTDVNHILLYAHGGLNSTSSAAKRIAAMKEIFLDNDIYPFHFMYDTGLLEELKDVVIGKSEIAKLITGGFKDWVDRRIEDLTRKIGRALWREMKIGAEMPFANNSSDGNDVLKKIISITQESGRDIKLHVVGHSTGAILHAYLLARAVLTYQNLTINTCSLLAPAATNSLFNTHYRPLLESGCIKNMCIYNLTEKLELDDHVAKAYQKSLLYLVSRAYEEDSLSPLLGMRKYNKLIDIREIPVEFVYSKGGTSGRSLSESHGGFDNDPATLNDILKRVLQATPKRKFFDKDLDY